MQAVLSGAITIIFYGMVVAAVWKLFAMASDLGEIKALLKDIRSNTASSAVAKHIPTSAPAPMTAGPAPVAARPAALPVLAEPISLESAEALLREVAEEEQALAQQAPPAAPPILAGPISLESAEALLREVAEEERALAQQPKTTA